MQSISVFLDIEKLADSQRKNADVRICVTDFEKGGLFGPPSLSRPKKAHPE